MNLGEESLVADLIDEEGHWNENLIRDNFALVDDELILRFRLSINSRRDFLI